MFVSWGLVLVLSFLRGKLRADTLSGQPTIPSNYSKILFIYSGAMGDFGWNYAQNLARNSLAYKYRDAIQLTYEVIQDNSDDATTNNVLQVLDQYYGKGYKIFIGCSFGYQFGFFNRTFAYPDARFINIGGFMVAPNMAVAFGKIFQAMYLQGLLAGLQTKTNQICFMAPLRIPDVIVNVNAFAVGLLESNPNATMYVAFTEQWYNLELEIYTGKFLLNQTNCDFFAQDSDSDGALVQALAKNAYGTGYNSDLSAVLGEYVVTSAIWNWFPLYDNLLQQIWNNTWLPYQNIYWGIETGIVDIAQLSFKVSYKTSLYIESKRQFLINNPAINNIFCGPSFNLSANKCLPDDALQSFTGPMTKLLTAPFRIVDLGDVSLPPQMNATAPPLECILNCSNQGICTAKLPSGTMCVCSTGYYGTACEHSFVPIIVGVLIAALVLIVAILKRHWIKTMIYGDLSKDKMVKDIEGERELLNQATKFKVKMEMATFVLLACYDIFHIVIEWISFSAVILHRTDLAQYFIDHPDLGENASNEYLLISSLDLDQGTLDVPSLIIVYGVFIAVADLILMFSLHFHITSFLHSYAEIKKGVSYREMMRRLGIEHNSIENLAASRSQVGVNTPPQVSQSSLPSMITGSMLDTQAPSQLKSGQQLLFIKRQIFQRSLQLLLLIFNILPFIVIKLYLLIGFLEIPYVKLSNFECTSMVLDIIVALIQVGMMTHFPKVFWTLRTSMKLALLEMNRNIQKRKNDKPKKASVMEMPADQSRAQLE